MSAAFATILRRYRREKNLSQADLAERANLDPTYISLLERNLRDPTLNTLFNLASALNIWPSKIVQEMEKL